MRVFAEAGWLSHERFQPFFLFHDVNAWTLFFRYHLFDQLSHKLTFDLNMLKVQLCSFRGEDKMSSLTTQAK